MIVRRAYHWIGFEFHEIWGGSDLAFIGGLLAVHVWTSRRFCGQLESQCCLSLSMSKNVFQHEEKETHLRALSCTKGDNVEKGEKA